MAGKYDLRHFAYGHLPPHLRRFSKPIGDLAKQMVEALPGGAERNAGLRKLLEAKDCFVRAAIEQIDPNVAPLYRADFGIDPRENPDEKLSGQIDPITGNPLPVGSPYSMAHDPVPSVTKAGSVVVCKNGHEICEVMSDLRTGDMHWNHKFGNWRQSEPPVGTLVDEIKCEVCGEEWINRPLITK